MVEMEMQPYPTRYISSCFLLSFFHFFLEFRVLSQKKLLKQRTYVSHNTFKFLCERIGPYFQKKSTCIREATETRVAMSLQRFGTQNMMYIVRKVYGMAKGIILEVMRDFCILVRIHFQSFFMQFPTHAPCRILAQEFYALHRIFYVMGSILGFHIPSLALVIA